MRTSEDVVEIDAYPDDEAVAVLRVTVAAMAQHMTPTALLGSVTDDLKKLYDAYPARDFLEIAAIAGTIASGALAIQVLARCCHGDLGRVVTADTAADDKAVN
jgi:hypothetical protein